MTDNRIRIHHKVKYEIRKGRFFKPPFCLFDWDGTCFGSLEWAHINYNHWSNVIPLCKRHHSKFDRNYPKTNELIRLMRIKGLNKIDIINLTSDLWDNINTL